MTVKLYVCNDDVKTVNKTLTEEKTLTVSITGNCSVISPNLKIATYDNLTSYNYLYISEWNRYYFIKDIVVDVGGKVYLQCAIDVLYTYRIYFGDVVACVMRSESIGKPTEIIDTALPINPNRKETKVIDLGSSIFTTTPTTPYMLTVQGT